MKKLLSVMLTALIAAMCLPFAFLTAGADDESGIARYSVLVLDVSDTADFISNNVTIYTADSAIDYVKKSADSFLETLINAEGNNYVAVVAFARDASVVLDFTNDYSNVSEKVNSLTSHDVVRDINSGLIAANELLQNTDPSVQKNIILVTTGMTNCGESSYEGHYNEETIGSNWYQISTGIKLYAYANAAYATAEVIKQTTTIYVLGLFQTMEDIPEKGKNIAEFFKITAADLASSIDTFHDVEDPEDLDMVFDEIADDITSVEYVVTLDANGGVLEETDTLKTNSEGKLDSLPTPTFEGYDFEGWYTDDGQMVTTDTVFEADTTIFARWIDIQTTTDTTNDEVTSTTSETTSTTSATIASSTSASTSKTSGSPKTGDDNNTSALLLVMLLSCGFAAGALAMKKRSND